MRIGANLDIECVGKQKCEKGRDENGRRRHRLSTAATTNELTKGTLIDLRYTHISTA